MDWEEREFVERRTVIGDIDGYVCVVVNDSTVSVSVLASTVCWSVPSVLLHAGWRRELIILGRNWFSRNECLGQKFPLSRSLLPRSDSH